MPVRANGRRAVPASGRRVSPRARVATPAARQPAHVPHVPRARFRGNAMQAAPMVRAAPRRTGHRAVMAMRVRRESLTANGANVRRAARDSPAHRAGPKVLSVLRAARREIVASARPALRAMKTRGGRQPAAHAVPAARVARTTHAVPSPLPRAANAPHGAIRTNRADAVLPSVRVSAPSAPALNRAAPSSAHREMKTRHAAVRQAGAISARLRDLANAASARSPRP